MLFHAGGFTEFKFKMKVKCCIHVFFSIAFEPNILVNEMYSPDWFSLHFTHLHTCEMMNLIKMLVSCVTMKFVEFG